MTPTDRSPGGHSGDDDSDGNGTDDSTGDSGQYGGEESRDERRRKRREAVRPHESGSEAGDPAVGADGDHEPGAEWAPEGVDPDEVPWYFAPVSVDDPDPPQIVDRLGSIGIALVVAALGLAILGIGAAAMGIQPFGNAAITLSLGLGTVAMLFGLVYQAFASDFLSNSE